MKRKSLSKQMKNIALVFMLAIPLFVLYNGASSGNNILVGAGFVLLAMSMAVPVIFK